MEDRLLRSSSPLQRVGEYIRSEVTDWDDEVISTARFKAFNGQRSDWFPRYSFWRDLILKVASHLGTFIISPSELKRIWFNRGGLTPLCLDDVLLEMYKDGDFLRREDLVNPRNSRFFQIVQRIVGVVGLSTSSDQKNILEDHLILVPLLKNKSAEIVKVISENHWTSSCIITLKKFQEFCGGSEEASAILSYLSGCRKLQFLTINKGELMEGVKISLSSQAVSTTSTLDYDVLHLASTAEKLQQQLDVINQRWETSRKLALASLRSGNKKVALKHAKEIKLASESREKCTALLNRVEEVIGAIADAESTNKVSEAIKIGAQAIKENKVSVEEVQLCLEELEDTIDSQKQVENILESTSSYTSIEDEDIEDEFKKLELEMESDTSQVPTSTVKVVTSTKEKEDLAIEESLCNALSDLHLKGGVQAAQVNQPFKTAVNKSKPQLEIA